MATTQIRRAAVIGGGVMGRGIAALLASARIPCYLFDIVPKAKEGDDPKDPAFRNSLATKSVEGLRKDKPSLIYSQRDIELITPVNVEDHAEKLSEVDFIIEAVPESMKIKHATFDLIARHANDHALIASNTSGLSIEEMLKGRDESFRGRFVVMHFFNPVRYMKLLEIIPSRATRDEVLKAAVEFGRDTLGKGIVFAKDTTNFVANRVGIHAMMSVIHAMEKYDMTPTDVDVIFSKPMGRPKSAVFGTADIVGLDTFIHVAKNCYDTLTQDPERELFKMPDFVHKMVEKGYLGRKTKAGFFKREKGVMYALNLDTLEYEERGDKPEFDSTSAARGPASARIRSVVVEGQDEAAKFAREVTLRSLAYSARLLGEIADDIVNIDRGMRWGFNWDLGPFESWDALGVKWATEQMKKAGFKVPAWVDKMIAEGHESFYIERGAERLYYDYKSGEYVPVPRDEKEVRVERLKKSDKSVRSNDGATLYDAGEGVLCLEIHTKMNTVDLDVIAMMEQAIEELEGSSSWQGLVIANDSDNFSVGANVALVVGAANSGEFDQIEQLIKRFQDANQQMRYSSKPVVVAPTGMTLGGGAEITMGANAVVAAGELYIGLVEFGVGLIPGGGGNLQLMRNVFGAHSQSKDFLAMPFLQKVFMSIGMAKVATSAEEAIEAGFMLAERDQVILNRDHLLYYAKQRALGMARAGWRPPRPSKFRLPGKDGYATIDMLLYSMVQDGQISEHDRLIGQKLATVLTGGTTSLQHLVSEQDLLDLERQGFLSLCGEQKTKDRMIHMVMKNKPLRN